MSPNTLRLSLLCSLACSALASGGSPARAEPAAGDVAQLLDRASGVAGGLTSDQLAAAARATSPQLAARAEDRLGWPFRSALASCVMPEKH